MTTSRGPRLELGDEGERLAAEYLRERGYTVLATNWHSRLGELDLIATIENVVVFVEVKTRTSFDHGTPADAVTYSKQQRIRTLALQWLSGSGRSFAHLRFDVLTVLVRRGFAPRIEHLEGAF